MGDLPGDVSRLRIDTADNARLVVNATREAVVITGFLQTGDLIESVNAIQLRPFPATPWSASPPRCWRHSRLAHRPAIRSTDY